MERSQKTLALSGPMPWLARAACLLALPTAEAIGWWLRKPFPMLHWASAGEALFPLAFFVTTAAVLAAREVDGALRLRTTVAVAHLGSLLLVETALRVSATPWLSAPLLVTSWLGSLCVWVPASRYLVHPVSRALVPGSLVAALAAFYDRTPGAVWEWLGAATATAVAFLSGALPGAVTWINAQGYLTLSYRSFVAHVGKACWGMESFFLFTLGFLLVKSLFADRLRRRGWFFFFLGAMPLLFALNAIRVVLVVAVGGLLVDKWGAVRGRELFDSFAHPYLGWALYVSVLAVYGALWLKIFRRTAKNPSIAAA